jgi:chloramphenicol-sensitive protein RarD
MATPTPSSRRRGPALAGVASGLGAYALWGVLPVFWKQLSAFRPEAILAFRVVFGALFLVGLLASARRVAELRVVFQNRRLLGLVTLASLLLTTNWYTYIWAVNAGFIVETSIGYYINPLVSVLLGVIVLGERASWRLLVCVGLAATGVVVLTLGYDHVPWIALALASSFASYSLIKKVVRLDSVVGITAETLVVFPFAVGGLAVLGLTRGWTLTPPGHAAVALSLTSGVVTVVPLILFAASARRLPLSTLGFLQYLAPTFQLLIGVFVYGEAFTSKHVVAFAFIWAAVLGFALPFGGRGGRSDATPRRFHSVEGPP